ncbi:MAG TPA: acyl-CoA dehydrogenase family protein [Streptosporangiaceae bacterium]|jgi:alkylation response protein AidB-like acyl-CoA dehydrogenase|nr:acyl-CoA dehydrogenase family protein [Streptosporangiaceae bacterium]
MTSHFAPREQGPPTTTYDYALAYARERERFGEKIGDFPAIAVKLACMKTKIAAARLLLRCARRRRRLSAVGVLEGYEHMQREGLPGEYDRDRRPRRDATCAQATRVRRPARGRPMR